MDDSTADDINLWFFSLLKVFGFIALYSDSVVEINLERK
jgi:hypothetical protein